MVLTEGQHPDASLSDSRPVLVYGLAFSGLVSAAMTKGREEELWVPEAWIPGKTLISGPEVMIPACRGSFSL